MKTNADGLIARIAQRLLALAAGCWHNWQTSNPGRHFTAHDHFGINHLPTAGGCR